MTKEKKSEKTDQKNKHDSTKLEERISELENNWKRALADYRNLEKRFAEEKSTVINFANLTLILRLLPVLDNLEIVQKHADDIGLSMILKEFKQILTDAGVVEIEVENRDFDPSEMDAIEVIEGGKDKVVEVVKKGYKLGEKVIRPASVKVGKG